MMHVVTSHLLLLFWCLILFIFHLIIHYSISFTNKMKLSCAAKSLCCMPTVPLATRTVCHQCMYCNTPMHGAMCGILFSEHGNYVPISYETLSMNGKRLYESDTALLCALCVNELDRNVVSSKRV